MPYFGRVVGREIAANKDSESESVLLQTTFDEPEDAQTVELFNQAGIHTSPLDDARNIVLSVGSEASKISIAVSDGITPELEPGEVDIFSIVDGAREARIKLVVTGDVIINNGEDNGVRYSALETAFNTLRDDFNSFVDTVYNVHQQTVAGTTAGVPVPLGVASTADISGAKIDNVRVP